MTTSMSIEELHDRVESLLYEVTGYRAQVKSLQGGVEIHENNIEGRREDIKKLRILAENTAAVREDAELKAKVIAGDAEARQQLAKTLTDLKAEVQQATEQLNSAQEALKALKQANSKTERGLLLSSSSSSSCMVANR